ncbi:hypothetical protein [Inhella proteolytica]|uniref:Uncharacterized protein n=1 Tax=Inhella proteolytica TaxID=2795029 RepID=A0A931J532_9BURK|nr:hypothetical protein [Inhella proteolytica]MBH9577017.1 hypothetical protein [Inhella proteolytica]
MQPSPLRVTLGLTVLLLVSCSDAPRNQINVPLTQYANQLALALGSPLWNLDRAATDRMLQLFLVPGIEHIEVHPGDPKSAALEVGQRPAQVPLCQIKRPIIYGSGDHQVQVGTLLINPRCEALS